ncbi:MAG: zinc ribbon domain-containing protein [Clostridiaceae bacterium]|jgi:hypothetical protein|nr:zinc ribbon domain-containing protein [Clostridiaceae bacterium]
MANDFLGGLGGLMKGLSGMGIPMNDPSTKMITAQIEVSDLQKQELELYAEMGKKAFAQCGTEKFAEEAERLQLVQSNLSIAQDKLAAATAEYENMKSEEKARICECTCSCCGYENPEGTKFCNGCGAKLIQWEKLFCVVCGEELAPGVRFCGQCGSEQP